MQTKDSMVTGFAQRILNEVRSVVVGKDQVLLWVLAAILAQGHILLEDIPGVGKTTMALAFSKVLDLSYSRVQFTPDVLPSDVTGYSVPDQQTGQLHYQPGAVLCNLFLADELNRATSRTQSALLEAMEEGQVTVDGVSYRLPDPFIVIATQNPAGAAGTQLLPDSQMDRFAIRMSLGYPNLEDEKAMVMNRLEKNPLEDMQPAGNSQTLTEMRKEVEKTYIHEAVVDYIVRLVDATRRDPNLLRGASPRVTLSLTAMSKAMAQLKGRDYVVPEDVQDVFVKTTAHRVLLTPKAESLGVTADTVLGNLLGRIAAPNTR